MANGFSKKRLGDKEQPQGTVTPTGQGVVGGVDKLVKDLQAQDMVGAYTVLFTGESSVKTWSQLKSKRGKTIYNETASIAKSSAQVVTEITKLSEALAKGEYSASPAVQHMSLVVGKLYSDLMKLLGERLGVKLPDESSTVQIAISKDTASSLASVAKAMSQVNDKTAKAAASLLSVISEYQNIDLTGVMKKIIEPLQGFNEENVSKIAASLSKLYEITTTGKPTLKDVIDSMSIEVPSSMFGLQEALASIVDIEKSLSEVGTAYDGTGTEALKSLHDTMSKDTPYMQELFDSLSSLQVPQNDISGAFGSLVAIAGQLSLLKDSIDKDAAKEAKAAIVAVSKAISGDPGLASLFSTLASLDTSADFKEKTAAISAVGTALETLFKLDFNKYASNSKSMITSIGALVEMMQKLPEIDTKGNLTEASASILKDIKGYEKNMVAAQAAQEKGMKASEAIIGNTTKMGDDMEEAADKAREASGKENSIAIQGLAQVVTSMGALMIVGSLITEKHPSFIRDAFRFGASLTVFVTMIVGATMLVQSIAKKDAVKSFDGLGRLVMSAGATMLIGALVYMKFGPEFSKYVRKFMLDFTVMIGLTSIAIRLIAKVMTNDAEKTLRAFTSLVMKCTVVMLIGALFVMNDRIWGASFRFGLVLAGFIAAVTFPLFLWGRLFRGPMETVKGLGSLIAACTLVMLIGSLVVTDTAFVMRALGFGVVLSLFIAAIMLPMRMISGIIAGEKKAWKAIRELNRMVVTMAAVLIVGSLFMQNQRLALGALEFAGLVAGFTFLMAASLKFVMGKLDIRAAAEFMRAFNRLVVLASMCLMIGGVYMTNTELALGALEFAGLVAGFTLVMSVVSMLVSKTFTSESLETMWTFMAFTAVMAAILYTGTYIVSKYKWQSILIAAGVFVAFTALMAGVFWLIGNIDNRKDALLNGLAIAAVTAVMGLAFGIVNIAMQGFEWKNMLMFVAGTALMSLVLLLLAHIKDTGRAIMNGLALAGVTAVIGLAFLVVKIAMKDFEWNQMLMFVAGTAMMALVFNLIKPISFKDVAIAMLVAVGIGLLGIAFGLVHEAVKDMRWEELGFMTATTAAMAAIFAIIGIPPVAALVALGAVVAAAMGGAILLLSTAIAAARDAVKDDPTHDLEVFGQATSVLIEGMAQYGLKTGAKIIMLAEMSLPLRNAAILIGEGILAARKAVNDDPTKDLEMFSTATKSLVESLTQYGLKTAAKVAVGAGVALATRGGVLSMAFALAAVKKAIEKSGEIKEDDIHGLSAMMAMVVSMMDSSNKESPFYEAKTRGVLKSAIAVRLAIVPMMQTISQVMNLVKNVATMSVPDKWDANANPTHYERLDTSIFPTATENIMASVNSLVSGFAELVKEPDVAAMIKDYEATKGLFGGGGKSSVANVANITKYISKAVGEVGDALYKFALLMVPDKWDSNGRATHYKQLNTSVFKTAAGNIMKSVTALVSGFTDLYQNPDIKELVDDMQDHTWYMGNGRSKVSAIFSMANGLSEMITNIAAAVQSFAASKFADKWNDKGTPIHFRELKDADYANAAKRVNLVISTMLEGIEQFGTDHQALLDEFEKEGFWNGLTGTPKSTISKAAKMSEKIGAIISNIATALSNYAKLMIPDKWDPKTGAPIHFTKFTDTDFETAKSRIVDILQSIPAAINGVDFDRSAKRKARRIANSIGGLSSMIADIAKVIVDIKSMRIPIYKDGKMEPTGYMNFDGDISDVTSNISLILSELPKAINAGYDAAVKDDKKAIENIASIASSYKPMTEMLSGMITSMQAYASLKAMPVYDGNGKLVKTVDLTSAIDGLGTNIGAILSGLVNGLASGVTKFKAALGVTGDTEDAIYEKVGSVITQMQPITSVFESLVKTVTAYADMKVPKYDNKGNITGYYTMLKDGKSFDAMFATISTNLSKILSGLLGAIGDAVPGSWIADDNETREKIMDGISKIADVVDPIVSVIDVVKNIAELKFPIGFSKDGKPNGYFTITTIPTDMLKDNISKILVALPNAVDSAWKEVGGTIEKLIGEGDDNGIIGKMTTGFNSIQEFIAVAFAAVDEYAKFKVPVEFDNDGNAKKYLSFDKKSISSLEDTIANIICALPNAMHKAVNDGVLLSEDDNAKVNSLSAITNKVVDEISGMFDTAVAKDLMKTVEDGNKFNSLLDSLATLTSSGLKFISATISTITMSFETAGSYLGNGQYSSTTRKAIIDEAKSAMRDFYELLMAFNMSAASKNSIIKDTMAAAQLSAQTSAFAKASKDLAEASATLVVVYENLEKVGPNGAENAKNMIDKVSEASASIKEDGLKKLDTQQKTFEKYVKAVDKIDIKKADAMVSMFEAMNKFSKSVGNLDKFTDTLANKIAVELKAFTAELKSAEKTISNADKLRKEREKVMEKTLDKISTIMSQTLNVTVSSKTGDSISGSQTYTEE